MKDLLIYSIVEYQELMNLILCVLIGSDIKKEAPVISSRIRHRYLNYEKPYNIFRIGEQNKTIFKTIDLGINSKSLLKMKEKKFSEILRKSSKPMFIIGQGAMCAERCRIYI